MEGASLKMTLNSRAVASYGFKRLECVDRPGQVLHYVPIAALHTVRHRALLVRVHGKVEDFARIRKYESPSFEIPGSVFQVLCIADGSSYQNLYAVRRFQKTVLPEPYD